MQADGSLHQTESEASDIYSEAFEEDEQQLPSAMENSDAESVQSSWHSPDLQTEASTDLYMKYSGSVTMLARPI